VFEGDIAKGIEEMIEASKENDKINVTFALNYGGRDELLRACHKMFKGVLEETLRLSGNTQVARSAQGDKLSLESLESLSNKLDGQLLEKYLDTAGMPDPDLIIRTGGAQRLSGFMLWQSEYSEFYFTEMFMPDFGAVEFDKALGEYACRCRRFGGGAGEDYK